jgi:hypothetical protein
VPEDVLTRAKALLDASSSNMSDEGDESGTRRRLQAMASLLLGQDKNNTNTEDGEGMGSFDMDRAKHLL